MTDQPPVTRLERAARNQALFREVNERLEDLAATFEQIAGTATFACECADLACAAQIEMSLDEYEAVRADPNNFIVLPGHVYPDVEFVIQESERLVVVAKIGEGAAIAASTNPRA